MLNRVFHLVFIFVIFISAAHASSENSIKIKINDTELRALIINQFPFLSNRLPVPSESDAILEFVILSQGYDYAKFVIGNDSQLELVTQKIKVIKEIKFSGLSEVSESSIRKRLNLSEKSVYDEQQLAESLETLKQIYFDQGFYQSEFSAKTINLDQNQIEVEFEIKEGVVTQITGIEFLTGDESLNRQLRRETDDYLREPLTKKNIQDMNKVIQSYLTKNQYFQAAILEPEIMVKDQTANIRFSVERAIKYQINIQGNQSESNRRVMNSLELENFISSNPDIRPELEVKIKNYYLKRGYARIQVTSEESILGSFSKSIQFQINEGPKVKIDKFEFSGRISRESSYYIEFIKNNSSELISDGYYNRDEIDLGVKNLVIDLQNQGYLSAKALAIRNTFNKDRDKILVSISFDEGPQTQLTELQVTGNIKFNKTEIQEMLGLPTGESLKLNILEQGLERIKSAYRKLGYLEMYLANENQDLVIYNQDNTKAVVSLKIVEGPQISVNSILIEGNSLTRDSVILKELDFKPGDILTPEVLTESISRLQRLGFFSSVEIKTLEEKTQISDRTVVVRVAERDPGLFNFGAGITNEQELTLRGYTGLSYRNIFGTGRGVSTRIESSYNVAKVKYPEVKTTIGYVEPYLFGTRTKGKINIVQSRTVTDFVDRRGTEIEQRTFAIEQDITSHVLFIYDLANLEKIKDFKIDGSFCTKCNEFDIVSTGPTVEVDYRNHPFNPTEGTFSRLNVEYASPDFLPSQIAPTGFTQTIKYIKSIASFTHYWTVWDKKSWVWANSFRMGYLENLSKLTDGGVPYDKKGLALGGQSTIRGFDPDEAFPSAKDFNTPSYLLKTRARMSLYKTELRFPIPWGSNLAGAVFYDGGQVELDDEGFTNIGWRDAAGIAARYITPVGAASLEIGQKLNRSETRKEKYFSFHFSIGTF